MVYLGVYKSEMCIELYINKILVFSQCEEEVVNSSVPNHTQVYVPNYTILNDTIVNLTNFTQNKTRITNLTNTHLFNETNHSFENFSSFTKNIDTNISTNLFNGTYINSTYFSNMTIQKSSVPSMAPNITVNHSLPMASDAPAADQLDVRQETGEIVLKIVIPLLVLGFMWILYVYSRRKKNKVQCVKMIENPYFGADVETEKEHKDPDVEANVEHKDPGGDEEQSGDAEQKDVEQKPKGTKLMTI